MCKLTIMDVHRKKKEGEKITMVTAYDYPTSKLVDKAGIDIILVGDSVGMVVLGYKSPIGVTLEDIIHHTKPVVKGAEKPLIIGDMPFMTYHVSVEETIRNAGRIIKEGGADAIKLEGGRNIVNKVKALVDAGIPVQGHIGLMPQRTIAGKIKIQGETYSTALEILKDAEALEKAGAFSIILEFITVETAKAISEKLTIPTIGIGSGPFCDGQVLVIHDLLGMYEKTPLFAKKYANLNKTILQALTKYREEVMERRYPSEEYCIKMPVDEGDKVVKNLKIQIL